MSLIRLLLLGLIAFWGYRRLVQWWSGLSRQRLHEQQPRQDSVPRDPVDRRPITDQPIEEADYEELP
jgi:hypothetical protein